MFVNASGELTYNDEQWSGTAVDGIVPHSTKYYDSDNTLLQEVEFLYFFSYEE